MPAVIAQPAQAPAARGTPKLVTALMPNILSREAPPGQLRKWCFEFKAFYSSSKLAPSTVSKQQAYLFKCLDEDLSNTLRVQTGDGPRFSAKSPRASLLSMKEMARWAPLTSGSACLAGGIPNRSDPDGNAPTPLLTVSPRKVSTATQMAASLTKKLDLDLQSMKAKP